MAGLGARGGSEPLGSELHGAGAAEGGAGSLDVRTQPIGGHAAVGSEAQRRRPPVGGSDGRSRQALGRVSEKGHKHRERPVREEALWGLRHSPSEESRDLTFRCLPSRGSSPGATGRSGSILLRLLSRVLRKPWAAPLVLPSVHSLLNLHVIHDFVPEVNSPTVMTMDKSKQVNKVPSPGDGASLSTCWRMESGKLMKVGRIWNPAVYLKVINNLEVKTHWKPSLCIRFLLKLGWVGMCTPGSTKRGAA
ncbi:uncharacterized protein LOC127684973 [Apodemus sylvaticus]|uniref:uncharacterized protein LOC127684973 n=1 Tax=Apodemus sylvaticus TaxID=10129 RepID=UPI002244DD86|nr:uncharacterized protein LOC127684973 [Apodemus sylvaticus]